MKAIKKYISIVLAFLCLVTFDLSAQFYNGTQMKFGKSRVQYKDFFWSYYPYKKFDIYFYLGGKELAEFSTKVIDEEIKNFEEFFSIEISSEAKVKFVVYNTLNEFKQSNIGNDEILASNTGGTASIIDDKVFLYYEGDHEGFIEQIKLNLASLFINKMLYGQTIAQQVKNNTLMIFPGWYTEGLASYLAYDWNNEIDNEVRDGILNNKYNKFNKLSGEDAVFVGHSMWKYISEKYGKNTITKIVFLSKITRNIDNGFMFVIGRSLKQLREEWLAYYNDIYQEIDSLRDMPDETVLKRTKKNVYYSQAKISNSGNYIAYSKNKMGKYKIKIINTINSRKKKVLKWEYKLDQQTDKLYPVITWHPKLDILTFVREHKGQIYLHRYKIEEKEHEIKELFYFDKVLSLNYSDSGLKMIISGAQKGQTDIYVYNFIGHTYERLTNDIYDDKEPCFINNDKQIVFSSNRAGDSLKPVIETMQFQDNYDLFVFDYQKESTVLRNITKTINVNETNPVVYDNSHMYSLSDANGVVNRSFTKFDSIISHIDTATHYRYIANSFPTTNYSYNINEHDLNIGSGKVVEILNYNNKFYLFKDDLPDVDSVKEVELVESVNLKEKEEIEVVDSISEDSVNINSELAIDDSTMADSSININNYIFEGEDLPIDSLIVNNESVDTLKTVEDSLPKYPKQRTYIPYFTISEIVSQLDNDFINPTYQVFTGGAPYFNPGINGFFKLGIKDLFEDQRIIGGMKLSGDLNSNEFFVSYENLKKRLDKQIIFYRQSIASSTITELRRRFSHELTYKVSYPFDQVISVKGDILFRNDSDVTLAIDKQSLLKPSVYDYWGGLKLALVFDNTREAGENALFGTKAKIFGEWRRQFDESNSNLFSAGFDFRNYTQISREFIWANRVAFGSSFGDKKIIYYLGGIDNWINISQTPTFDNETDIDFSQNYAYQTLATNMRGFSQNIRNGNNFGVINSELRFPVFRYFYNRPLKSEFLSSLQIIGFGDAGMAWVGKDPFSDENVFKETVVYPTTQPFNPNTYKVTLIEENYPIVMGYGFGLRARMFGYFMRLDWAWGYENGLPTPRVFYFSLAHDF